MRYPNVNLKVKSTTEQSVGVLKEDLEVKTYF